MTTVAEAQDSVDRVNAGLDELVRTIDTLIDELEAANEEIEDLKSELEDAHNDTRIAPARARGRTSEGVRMNTNTEEKDWLEDLETAWKGADSDIPKAGDTIIADERHRGHGFHVYQATKDHPHGYDNIRILKQAPEPEFQAVMAGYIADEQFNVDPAVRHVWTSRGGGYWESIVDFVQSDQLVDPAPLVELPSHEELARAILQVGIDHGVKWPESDTLADAVLELLEGK